MNRPTRQLLTRQQVLDRLDERRADTVGISAMFSSYLGGVFTDPALMQVPIDDHLLHRGHGVFDTATLSDGRLFRVEAHVKRLLTSASLARIDHPWGHSDIIEMIIDTAAASGVRDGSVRYWLSPGPGGFSFSPDECEEPCFYCVIYDPARYGLGEDLMLHGVAEATVVDTPMKPTLLATVKSNNYLLNVLTHMEAVDRGGTFGILVHPDGRLAESCVLNAVIITTEGQLLTPPFDGILAGTTVQKVLDLARTQLVPEGVLTDVAQRPLIADEHRGSTTAEMFLTGGDTHLFPVTSWDGVTIGDGGVGPVTRHLQSLLEAEVADGRGDDFIEVVYP